jgi:predicted ATP-binding protein involved in virulence
MDKRIIHEQLLNEHRMLINKISDIKSQSVELNPQQKNEISNLEKKVKLIAEKLYNLYK